MTDEHKTELAAALKAARQQVIVFFANDSDKQKAEHAATLKKSHRQLINAIKERGGHDENDEYEICIEGIEFRMDALGIPFDPWVPGQPAPEDAE